MPIRANQDCFGEFCLIYVQCDFHVGLTRQVSSYKPEEVNSDSVQKIGAISFPLLRFMEFILLIYQTKGHTCHCMHLPAIGLSNHLPVVLGDRTGFG